MKIGSCKHYHGAEEVCGAGVNIRKHVGGPDLGWGTRIPCLPGSPFIKDPAQVVPCEKFERYTAEDKARDDAEFERKFGLIAKDLSPCCEALIDRSEIIASGRYKGNGWLVCSKCRTPFMHVCARTGEV